MNNKKNCFVVIVDQGIIALGNFATVVFIGKILSVKDFGIYILAFTTMVMLSSLSYSFVYTPMSVLCQEYSGLVKKHAINANYLLQNLIICINLACIFLFLSYHKDFYDLNYTIILSYLICVFFYLTQEFYRMVYFIDSSINLLLISDVLMTFSRLFLLFYFAYIKMLTLHIVLILYIVSYIFPVLIGYMYFKFNLLVSKEYLRGVIVKNFKYGKWLIGESFLYFFSNQFYLYLTATITNVESVAAVSACQSLLNSTNFIMNGMSNYLVPLASKKFIKDGFAEMSRYVFSMAFPFITTVIVIIISIVFFKDYLLNIFYNNKYQVFSYLVFYIALQFIFDLLSRPFIVIFRSSLLPNYGFKLKVASFIATLFIAYPLVCNFEIFGAVLGQMFTFMIWFIFSIVFYLKLKNSKFSMVEQNL